MFIPFEARRLSDWNIYSSSSQETASILFDGQTSVEYLNIEKTTAYRFVVSQTIKQLEPGYYTLTAIIKNGGGQQKCYIYADAANGEIRLTSLPVSSEWLEVIVRGIEVREGECTIGLYTEAAGGNWCSIHSFELVRSDRSYELLKGGDISELPRIEENGGIYRDQNEPKDGLAILKAYGHNIVRIRLYNDPGNPDFWPSNQLDERGYQNEERTLALAKRAKEQGFQIQFSFHYSDYWTNGAAQHKPHAWEGLAFDELKEALYQYTRTFMERLVSQGTAPEYVSLGNEIQGGICYPDASVANWPQLAELLKAGYRAVKEVSEQSKVVIHLDGATEDAKYEQFFGNCERYGVPYDIIGPSYYPFWTQASVQQLVEFCNKLVQRFDKDILLMETGFNWNRATGSGMRGQLENNGPEPYESTPEGQRDFLYALMNGIKQVEQGRCLGVLYWDPVMIYVPGVGWQKDAPNVVDNTTLFDFDGNALPAMLAYKYNN
ncbi:glycosyl hydrolase 53 family protein [Paenibacillus sp. LHD-38]|uniref:glycoside hydrolase family 53 protein n=1 Tax=Paenibacillus sp. LHD-38 TaxID=3072143 RepID=UPI00280F42B5|nr:glycosyl hydrolase 53 family protein [Paenibacillus sp. LHD-38]MDQ8733105.1 glycosyl hydrolase 53 family protein [Paenibacillus sp. LHD-38]